MSDVNKIYDREKSGKSLYNLIRIHKYIQFNLTFILFSLSLISLIWESQLLLTKHDKKNKKGSLFFYFYRNYNRYSKNSKKKIGNEISSFFNILLLSFTFSKPWTSKLSVRILQWSDLQYTDRKKWVLVEGGTSSNRFNNFFNVSNKSFFIHHISGRKPWP